MDNLSRTIVSSYPSQPAPNLRKTQAESPLPLPLPFPSHLLSSDEPSPLSNEWTTTPIQLPTPCFPKPLFFNTLFQNTNNKEPSQDDKLLTSSDSSDSYDTSSSSSLDDDNFQLGSGGQSALLKRKRVDPKKSQFGPNFLLKPARRCRVVNRQPPPIRTLHKYPTSEGIEAWHYNGEQYPVELLGQGKFHKVFRFTDAAGDKTITIHLKNGTNIERPMKDLVLRAINGSAKVKKNLEAKQRGINWLELEDIKAQQVFEKRGIPLPHMYATPETILDPNNANNGAVAVVERLHNIENTLLEELETGNLSKEAQQLKDWVIDMFQKDIDYLTNNAERRMFDFKPDNVMYRWIEVQQPDGNTLGQKEYVLADAQLSPNKNSLWDTAFDLATDIYKWSASNEQFAKCLLDMVPESIEYNPQVESDSRKRKSYSLKANVVEQYTTAKERHS